MTRPSRQRGGVHQITCAQVREGERATIVEHDFLGQRFEAEARKFEVSDAGPGIDDCGNDYDKGVIVRYVPHGRRKWQRAYAVNDNWSFLVVERCRQLTSGLTASPVELITQPSRRWQRCASRASVQRPRC